MNKISSQDVSLFLEKLAAPSYYSTKKPAPKGSSLGDNKAQLWDNDLDFAADADLQHLKTTAKTEAIRLAGGSKSPPVKDINGQTASGSGSISKSPFQPAKLKFW